MKKHKHTIQTRNFFSAPVWPFGDFPEHGQMKSRQWRRERTKATAIIFVVCLLASGLFAVAHLVAKAMAVKNSATVQALAGVNSLMQAKQALSGQNAVGADQNFSAAARNFSTAQKEIDASNWPVRILLDILPQGRSAKHLLSAATILSQAGQNTTVLYSEAQTLHLSAQGLEGQAPTATLVTMNSQLNTITKQITQASTNLMEVEPGSIPTAQRPQFLQLQQQLPTLTAAAQNIAQIFGLFSTIVNSNPNVLVFFENNDELRPGGGFMGTYGNFQLESGKINNLMVSSIYDLDGQLRAKIIPPSPILNVSNRWFLRDSNWFANFPQDAQTAEWFYEQEGGKAADDVIIMTPTLFSDMLKITGPVSVPTFNVTLTSDNFVEDIEAISTISYNTPLNKPKQILADFFPIFLQKLSTLSTPQMVQLLGVLQANLASKQLAFYSNNADAEQTLLDFDWAGQVASSSRDYLSVISSNLDGTKTDLSLQKQYSLTTAIAPNGTIIDQLTITVTSTEPNLPDLQNESFLRVLVPQGSRLVSDEGFDTKTLPDPGSLTGFLTNDNVATWQSSIATTSDGTFIGSEAGKTFFGNWLTVPPGQTKTVTITYQLPYSLQSTDEFSLVLQKQVGSVNEDFNYRINFPGRTLKWQNTPAASTLSSLEINQPLNQDKFYGFVFRSS